MAFDWRTRDLALAMPSWEQAETMTAQRYRGRKVSQVPKSDQNIPLPKWVAERLNRILLDSLPGCVVEEGAGLPTDGSAPSGDVGHDSQTTVLHRRTTVVRDRRYECLMAVKPGQPSDRCLCEPYRGDRRRRRAYPGGDPTPLATSITPANFR